MSKLKNKRPIHLMTHKEIRSLLSRCKKRTYQGIRAHTMILFLWRSQVRVSEAIGLTIDNLDIDRGMAVVQGGKGFKRRIVGFDPQTGEALRRYLDRRAMYAPPDCRLVFPTTAGKRILREHFARTMLWLAGQAGITRHVHPRCLRDAGALELLNEGFSLPDIQAQLGHSSVAITMAYLKRLKPAFVAVPPRQRLF